MTAQVTIIGADQAMADMRRWADELAPAVDKAAEPFARDVASRVRGEVPHVTGALAASVEVSAEEEGIAVQIGDGVPYAGWIEFGGTRGRPYVSEGRYLFPTAAEAEDDYAVIAADAADESARRFSWSTPTT